MCGCWVWRREEFVLFEHEPMSQEEKMTTRMDGRTKEEKNKKGKTWTECMSRIRICGADIAIVQPVLQQATFEKTKKTSKDVL